MKKIAIIVAGGAGTRMGSSTPKQFLQLQNKPILWHTIYAFVAAFNHIEIVLVLPKIHQAEGESLSKMFPSVAIKIVVGGETRFHSVKNGLATLDPTNDAVVFVHDGVRCLVTPQLIVNCYNQTIETGSAIPAVTATDSIRLSADQRNSTVVDRNQVKIIQTPQTFQQRLLLEAFKQEYVPAFTDEATVVEASGKNVWLIEGEYSNVKITRPIDLLIAEKILEERAE